jgi:3-phytase
VFAAALALCVGAWAAYTTFGYVMDDVASVMAVAETEPVRLPGDRADDAAIWVHPTDPTGSVVIGTNKGRLGTRADGALNVYALDGRMLQSVGEFGAMNNVDLRDGFPLGNARITLVAASNVSRQTIALFAIDPQTRRLRPVAARALRTGLADSGCCLFRDAGGDGRLYVFVTAATGHVQQWELFGAGDRVDAKRVRTFELPGETEGCVADDAVGAVYISQESRGVWRFDARPDGGATGELVIPVGRHVKAEVEGLAIYPTAEQSGFLIVSSQGSSRFVLFDRERPRHYVATFRVAPGHTIDGCEQTDGIAVTASPLGPVFTHGLFVAHDHANREGGANFKLVPWHRIAEAAGLEY